MDKSILELESQAPSVWKREAIRRVVLSDAIVEILAEDHLEAEERERLFREMCHLRQTAPTCAILATIQVS